MKKSWLVLSVLALAACGSDTSYRKETRVEPSAGGYRATTVEKREDDSGTYVKRTKTTSDANTAASVNTTTTRTVSDPDGWFNKSTSTQTTVEETRY